jgi:basic membrane protein A
MRRLRRFELVAVIISLALLGGACSGDDDAKPGATTSTTSRSKTTSTSRPSSPAGPVRTIGLAYDLAGRGDHSFNDAAAAGFDRAKQELGIALKEAKPDVTGSNRAAVVQKLVDEGSDLTFGVGFLYADPIAVVAKTHPGARFAIVDAAVDAPNVASLTFATNEGAFLVGAAAALTSKTGKIGFLGGVPLPEIKRVETGYVAGAKYAKSDITIDVRYVTQPPDMSGFSSPPKAHTVAASQFSSGVDVVYQAARGSGAGVFVAAKERSDASHTHVWAIGNDTDQHATVDATLVTYILTSMVKKIDVAVYDTIERQHGGTDLGGTTTVYGVKSGGVDYATSGGFVDGIRARLDDIKRKIADGTITVPTTA